MESASQRVTPPGGLPQYILVALGLTLAHGISCIGVMIVSAVAPAVARDYGIDASLIGYQISCIAAGLLISLALFGNLTRRVGACRANQLGHAAVAASMICMLIPVPLLLIPGAFLMGVGFGLFGPSNSTLLIRFSPEHRRNFVFSFQQTAIPLGGMLAALGGPLIAVHFGWRWALLVLLVLELSVIALMHRVRPVWDAGRMGDPTVPLISRNPLGNLGASWRHPQMRLLSLTGAAFCWAQFCVSAYTVVTCVEALDMSLVAAGLVLLVVNFWTAAGRVLVGWLADKVSAARVLEWAAWLMLFTCIAFAALAPSWPAVAVYAVFSMLGITSGAWSGLVLAEIGRLAPKGQVASYTSGMLVYTNVGKLVGPMVFAITYKAIGSYALAFALVGIPSAFAVWAVRRARAAMLRLESS